MSDSPIPTRDRIVEESRALFAEHGFHGSSIRDIARALGVSVSAVYNHFASKEAILLEVLRRPTVDMLAIVEAENAASEGLDPRERLQRILRVHYRHMLDFKQDAELLGSEYQRLQQPSRAEVVRLRNAYEAQFRVRVVDCLPEPMRNDAAISVTTNLLLGVTSTTHRWFRDAGPMSREQMADHCVRFAMAGFAGTFGLAHFTD
jgi:AcrR family transcriptional regulator